MNVAVTQVQTAVGFAHPALLWGALAGGALFAAVLWRGVSRRRKLLAAFADPALHARLGVPGAGAAARGGFAGWLAAWGRPAALLAAFLCLALGAARPRWGAEERTVSARGIDLFVALDVSSSMLAQDYQPSRLDRARALLQDVLWRAKGHRVGIVAFAGSAQVKCPLTLDAAMASAALKSVGPGSVESAGTSLGSAIDAATKAFETGAPGERVLVLLTDGEDQGSDPLAAARRAAAAGVRVHCVGIGTSQGVPIPGRGGYKTDRDGNTVTSRLDFDTLSEIAKIGGGLAVKANPKGGTELDPILAAIDGLAKSERSDRVLRVHRERFGWLAAPAAALLAWEAAFAGGAAGAGLWRRRRRRVAVDRTAAPAAAAAIVPVLVIAVLAGAPRGAVAYPGEDVVLSRQARERYQAGDAAAAEALYRRAAEIRKDAPGARYNTGAAALKAGRADVAEKELKASLETPAPGAAGGAATNPADPAVNARAAYNLGLIEQGRARPAIEKAAAAIAAAKAPGAGPGQLPAPTPPPVPGATPAPAPGPLTDEARKALIEELKTAEKSIEAAAGRYRQALMQTAEDGDMKFNYEAARRDLDLIRRRMEELTPPPPPPNPDQQKPDQTPPPQPDKKPDDKPQDGGKGQPPPQPSPTPGPDDPKDKPDDKQPPKDGKDGKSDTKPGATPTPKPDAEPKEGDGKDQEDPKGKPTPTPAATPPPKPGAGPTPTPTPGPDAGKDGKDGKDAKDAPKDKGEAAPGEMSERDVERLLNSLPPENPRALQNALNVPTAPKRDMEKDW